MTAAIKPKSYDFFKDSVDIFTNYAYN